MKEFDIEDLKIRKIPTEKKRKVLLPVAGPRVADVPVDNVELAGAHADIELSVDVLRERVVDALRHVYDPEIPVNVFDLGLIYALNIDSERVVSVDMTLTAPACPVAGMIVQEVSARVAQTEGVRRVSVRLVWDPPWTKARMSEEALLELGLM